MFYCNPENVFRYCKKVKQNNVMLVQFRHYSGHQTPVEKVYFCCHTNSCIAKSLLVFLFLVYRAAYCNQVNKLVSASVSLLHVNNFCIIGAIKEVKFTVEQTVPSEMRSFKGWIPYILHMEVVFSTACTVDGYYVFCLCE